MAVTWTEEQRQVINVRDKDVLVSAAAGSGKTAVLVERIISRITDPVHSVDIDRLLVVTFTNAAAAEMRERIRDALEQKAEQEPENTHLQKQLVLIHHASITTIHSFCLKVLRSHFHTIGLDPAFRIADEGEIRLLEQDTVKEVLDEAYEKKAPEFHAFLECLATGKSDDMIPELILQLYHFSLGHPWPDEWLEECCGMYERKETGFAENPDQSQRKGLENDGKQSVRDAEALNGRTQHGWGQQPWLEFLVQDVRHLLSDMQEELREAVQIAEQPDGPYPYLKALESDAQILERLAVAQDYDTLAGAFAQMGSLARLAAIRDKTISEEKKLQVQEIRNQIKKELSDIRDRYFYAGIDEIQEEFYESGQIVRVLAELTRAFSTRFAKKKAEKNLLDFGDLEHFALEILLAKENGKAVPTAAAKEYAEVYEEVMTDEYQDSNLVQEFILKSVSGAGCGAHNRFMVGDVKQSIYRFRLARPELFMEKYRTYVREEDENTCRIDLHKNFRSRSQVLEGVNYIFRQIMTEGLGGVTYDDDAALYPGAVFAEGNDASFLPTEILLLEPDRRSGGAGQENEEKNQEIRKAVSRNEVEESDNRSEAGKEKPESREKEGEPENRSEVGKGESESWGRANTEIQSETEKEKQENQENKQEAEARLVGRRILEIVGHEKVWDKELSAYRPASWCDIVILLRTVSGWAESFQEVLSDMGIPCFTGSQTGYFSAAEVRVVLSYLQILDNPVQDIPLAAVLRSPIGGFSDEELAIIRAKAPGYYFYECCRNFWAMGAEAEEKAICEKLGRFFETYEQFRAKTACTPVHLLLWEILDVTGYGAYAAALPAGAQRRANLDMLVEKAIAYEATSYRGLYHFVRYIENLKKYEVDYGEASISGEADDTVRIMSIHKSKGLEFPIVFVSGISKRFNESDARSRIALHPELGIGCDFVDPGQRVKAPNLLKRVIQRQLRQESLGEELRVLYVAMTRAKEKLILTGTVSDFEKKMESYGRGRTREETELSYTQLSSASSYMDWVIPALLHHPDASDWNGEANGQTLFYCACMPASRQTLYRLMTENEESLRLQQLLQMDTEVCQDEQAAAYLERVFHAVYPFESDQEIRGKLSVSELKRMSQIPETEEGDQLYEEEPVVPLVPQFRNEGEVLAGAARGTVYHIFMQNLDFSKKVSLEMQLEELIKCGKMTREEGESLNLEDIRVFLASEIGQRMEQASGRGTLYREQPFVIGVPANTVRSEWNPEETVLVQGIIDAFFYDEDGKIILLDYKTDHVRSVRALVEKYRPQLTYYAEALERLTARRVKRRVIYSFHLGREIIL